MNLGERNEICLAIPKTILMKTCLSFYPKCTLQDCLSCSTVPLTWYPWLLHSWAQIACSGFNFDTLLVLTSMLDPCLFLSVSQTQMWPLQTLTC